MPQGRRKLPFSGKQKKQQIQEKRKRKQLNAASGRKHLEYQIIRSQLCSCFGLYFLNF